MFDVSKVHPAPCEFRPLACEQRIPQSKLLLIDNFANQISLRESSYAWFWLFFANVYFSLIFCLLRSGYSHACPIWNVLDWVPRVQITSHLKCIKLVCVQVSLYLQSIVNSHDIFINIKHGYYLVVCLVNILVNIAPPRLNLYSRSKSEFSWSV